MSQGKIRLKQDKVLIFLICIRDAAIVTLYYCCDYLNQMKSVNLLAGYLEDAEETNVLAHPTLPTLFCISSLRGEKTPKHETELPVAANLGGETDRGHSHAGFRSWNCMIWVCLFCFLWKKIKGF